ncbi:MAG TPA: ATP-binding protein [Gemmatimonadaceae bacterium]|nr:ATP-binding protein [Gemmatimonadaceae bacterium]
MTDGIFVSSVQRELAEERRAIREFVSTNQLLRRFFDVFLFEDLPATDRRVDDVYLEHVGRCAIYLGVFGNEYGSVDAQGVSPTEREFDHATALGKTRLILLKGIDDSARDPRMRSLIEKAVGQGQLIRKRFSEVDGLTSAVYASLVDHLERTGRLRTKPFDAAACPDATLADISSDAVELFLSRARQVRGYALGPGTPTKQALIHLNLLDGETPSHAAVLLFGLKPQHFLVTSEVKCAHFHGTEVGKPIPSYQIYRGTLFELIDQAVDFVMSKVARSVGTRAESVQSPVEYELPPEAVAEAIVNAVAHRDYTSNASVQVSLFADRLEVWNPGELPPALTIEQLQRPHASVPRNPLIAEPLFLAGYVEKAGTGILDMIARCREAGLPAPEFRQEGGEFIQVLRRPGGVATPQVTPQVTTSSKTFSDSELSDIASVLGVTTPQVTPQVATQVLRIIEAARTAPASREELQRATNLSDRKHFRTAYLEPLVKAGWLERTIPEKPTSRLQRYRLGEPARTWLTRRSRARRGQ